MAKKKDPFVLERSTFDLQPLQRPFCAARRFVLKDDPRASLPIVRMTDAFMRHVTHDPGVICRSWKPVRVMSIRINSLVSHRDMLAKIGGIELARLSAEIIFRLLQMHGVFGSTIGPLLRTALMSNIFYIPDRFGKDVIVSIVFTGSNHNEGWVLDAEPVSRPSGCIPTGSRIFYPSPLFGDGLPDVERGDADLIIDPDDP
ncbi:MAG: hypothetical protein RL150_564 [Candidatus Parcubacteria bacterium]|jgi:hypothetical protein